LEFPTNASSGAGQLLVDECETEETSACCNAEGYGEMAPASVETMAGMLNASSESPIESFFDLGSGTGRLVLHLAVKGYTRLSTGVELNGARHAFATELAQGALPAEMPKAAQHVDASPAQALASGVQLLQGNMLNANITSATVLYMNPACLSCSTKRQLVQKILQESPNLQFILTTYPLRGIADSEEFVELQTEFLSPMIGYEWQIPVALYKRSRSVSTTSSSTAADSRKHLRGP